MEYLQFYRPICMSLEFLIFWRKFHLGNLIWFLCYIDKQIFNFRDIFRNRMSGQDVKVVILPSVSTCWFFIFVLQNWIVDTFLIYQWVGCCWAILHGSCSGMYQNCYISNGVALWSLWYAYFLSYINYVGSEIPSLIPFPFYCFCICFRWGRRPSWSETWKM